MGPPPPAPLPDEIVEEILLRIPPSDPVTLARAAVAQKRWCRLVAGDGFRRRYRALHRAPPMLGFLCDPRDCIVVSTRFVPSSSFRPKLRFGNRQQLPEDARHGRVLLLSYRQFVCSVKPGFRLVVWDPIGGHFVALPRVNVFCYKWQWKATVLCAAPAGSCDHFDCHRGHFVVVLIGDDYPRGMLSCVYSSQDGAWSKVIFARHIRASLGVYSERCAHVGNALYCMTGRGNKILKYDLGTREFSVMEPPDLLSCEEYIESERIQLTSMEDGQLGLAVLRQSTLYILSTDEQLDGEEPKSSILKNVVIMTHRPHLF